MDLFYMIGPPGAGKSTTMTALTAGCDRVYRPKPLHHELLVAPATGDPVAVELGRSRPGFPGTDTLPLNVAPVAARWVAEAPAALILAEGDRLAHAGFLEAAEAAGYRVLVAYLHAGVDVLSERCAARGSSQNEAWRRGRATKANRLAEWAATRYPHTDIDTAAADTAGVINQLRAAFPALDALPEVTECLAA